MPHDAADDDDDDGVSSRTMAHHFTPASLTPHHPTHNIHLLLDLPVTSLGLRLSPAHQVLAISSLSCVK